jgi:ABC-type phosphate/phosphonate transport system ATPase subunit
MQKTIFPKEITRFSVENHYSRFSRHSRAIYVLLVATVIAFLLVLPFIVFDVSVQSRGIIRSQSEPTAIQAPVTGQVQEIRISENMKVAAGDTLIRLASGKINDQMQILDEKIALYESYIHDLIALTNEKEGILQSELLKSSYSGYNQKLKEYQLRIEMTAKDFDRTKSLYEKEVIAAAEFEKKELELNQLIRERDFYVSPKKADWHQQLFQYKTELRTLIDSRDQLKFKKRFYVIVAPADGYISNFAGIKAGSVIENIAIGELAPDMELLFSVCQQLGMIEFIEKLPNGFQTYIGENGATLSGGQRQRLAIARALYRQPEILIMDEATSNLDSESEQVVHQTVRQLVADGKTVILIAHRLSTVVDAHQIIVLKDGQIAEQGPHAALFAQKGYYYDMWQRQMPGLEASPNPTQRGEIKKQQANNQC